MYWADMHNVHTYKPVGCIVCVYTDTGVPILEHIKTIILTVLYY